MRISTTPTATFWIHVGTPIDLLGSQMGASPRAGRSARAGLAHDLGGDPGRSVGKCSADCGVERVENPGFGCRPDGCSERPHLEGRTGRLGCSPCRYHMWAGGTGDERLDEDFPDDCHGHMVRLGRADFPRRARCWSRTS